jgi:hypothetical protein
MKHHRANPPGATSELAAAYVASGGSDDIPVEQAAERWRIKSAKLTAAERERYMLDGHRLLREATPDMLSGTARTPEGGQVPCEYAIVDEAYATAWTEARQLANIDHAGWLIRRARHGLRPAVVGSRRRESHRTRPGHRRAVATRAGPSDDDDPAEPEAAHSRRTSEGATA